MNGPFKAQSIPVMAVSSDTAQPAPVCSRDNTIAQRRADHNQQMGAGATARSGRVAGRSGPLAAVSRDETQNFSVSFIGEGIYGAVRPLFDVTDADAELEAFGLCRRSVGGDLHAHDGLSAQPADQHAAA